MSTTLTPPPGPQPSPVTPPPAPQRNPAGRVVAIIAIVAGALILVGALTTGIIGAIARAAGPTDDRIVVDATGVDTLDVDAAAGDVRVLFTDTDEAVLDVTAGAGAGRWTLTREGDELVVRSPQRWFGGWWFYDGPTRVVLELPENLQDDLLDARLTLSAGSLDVDGEFGTLDLEVNAGRADLEIADVATADLDVSAGGLKAVFTGDAPEDVAIDVSAGSLDLAVPSGAYRVASDVSAGGLDNRLETSSQASRLITVSLSAGDVTLRSGR